MSVTNICGVFCLFILLFVEQQYSTKSIVDDYGNRWLEIDSAPFLSDNCMRCLCAASSDCKVNARCHSIEPDKRLCGPFRITEEYWKMAGNLTPDTVWQGNNPFDFEICAHNLECSLKTVDSLIKLFFSRCGLLDVLNKNNKNRIKNRCTLAAFLHYREIYQMDSYTSNEDYDSDDGSDTAEQSSDDRRTNEIIDPTRGFDDQSMSLFCDIDISNIDGEIQKMYRKVPATRSDDKFWNRFEECSQLFTA